ncbi:MAG TPA: ribosomal-processing cysteine protease Prp [Firmicutes bacterium]|jgi:uncharacterized protein YsxB (DUF464 family)|nr:ribosomal-processing cysteine protease Prp [Bacillota bacterium]
MITVEFFHSPRGELIGFHAAGHSGYAERGYDIVCAAVSALTLTVTKGLIEQVGLNPTVRQGPGELFCRIDNYGALSPGEKHAADLLLQTLLGGLKEIVDQYPDFVRLRLERRPDPNATL